MTEENSGPATPEEILHLEEFIPTRLTCLTLFQVSVTVSMAEFNLLHTLMPVIMGHKVVLTVNSIHTTPDQVRRPTMAYAQPHLIMYNPHSHSLVR